MTQQNPFLLAKEISDIYARQNFLNLQDYFAANNQLLGFVFFEKQFTAAVSNQKIAHGLPTIPRDVLVSKIVGSGTVTFNHGLFDNTNIDVTVTGACTVRFFVGTYWNSGKTANPATTDSQSFASQVFTSSGQTYPQVTVPLTSAQVSSGSFPGSTTANYLVKTTDSVVFSSGTTTVTLPLASTCINQKFTVYKTDQTFLITTIACQASNSIGGLSTTTLNTYQERVELLSTGLAWVILTRDYYKGPTAYTPATSTPLAAVTSGFWWRQGNKICIDTKIAYSGATTGSVTIALGLPSPLVVDNSPLVYTTNVQVNIVGRGIYVSSAGLAYDASVYMLPTDTNLIKFGGLQNLATFTGTVYPNDTDFTSAVPVAIASTASLIMNAAIPISGWKG